MVRPWRRHAAAVRVPTRRLATGGREAAALLLLALLAALLPRCGGTPGCNYTLSTSPLTTALPAAFEDEGWCRAFSSSGAAQSVNVTCRGIAVPPGTVVAFGTCGLAGAACTGATRLALRDARTGAVLSAVDRVRAGSPMASLELGCVLGHRCSYGEWRNPALVAASVFVEQGCVGVEPCTGVVGWRLRSDPALLPALAPSTTPALAFTVKATAALSLSGLAGNITAGATAAVWRYTGDAVAGGALGANTNWVQLWSGAWPSSGPVPLSPATALAAGATATLMVVATAGGAPVCAHTLGDSTQTLVSDARALIAQGAAMSAAFAGPSGSACAWDGLSLSYAAATACPPPPPPPGPLIPTTAGVTLARSLDDLLRALADPRVTAVIIDAHIQLNDTAPLQVALASPGASRVLKIQGSDLCDASGALSTQCSISGAGMARVLLVDEGVSVQIKHLQLRDGMAPENTAGGCVLMNCSSCAVTFDGARLSNCTAKGGAGGGLASLGGGAVSATSLVLEENIAAVGGGLAVVGSVVSLNTTSFVDNVASGLSDNAVGLSDLGGTLGGGAALFDSDSTLTGCVFNSNAAYTEDVLLTINNPALPQARGGALFVYGGSLALSGGSLDSNTASFGGAIYIDDSAVTLTACSLVFNDATTGNGGALFAADCRAVTLLNTLVEGNSAGGAMGGAIAVLNASVVVSGCSLRDNWAPAGCGGAMGINTDGTLLLDTATVVMGNQALSGGGLCCDECAALTVADSFLYDNAALSGAGGALAVTLTPTTVVNSTLARNQAPQGGAVHASSSMLNITDCTLTGNAATDKHGGAVFHDSVDNGVEAMLLLRSVIANNSARAAGGGVAAFSSGSVLVDSCTLVNNSATGPAPSGGGIASLDVTQFDVRACTLAGNWVEVAAALAADSGLAYIDSLQMPGSGSGGALWIGADEALNASVLSTSLVDNWAAQAGGIYLTGDVTLLMRDSQLLRNLAAGYSSEGGGLMTDRDSVANVYSTLFKGCAAVRGGAGWHGAASRSMYDGCRFEENQALDGDDIKGSALIVGDESSSVLVTRSQFVRNVGSPDSEGTVAMEHSGDTSLRVTDSIFDGNSARLGAGFLIAAHSQLQQFSLSNVTFRNQRAYIGAVMYAESAEYGPLSCSPACDWSSNNSALDYGDTLATPPKQINVSLPPTVRSGAPLSVLVTMRDGFGALLVNWDGLVATIETEAQLVGTVRTFYLDGAATFDKLALFGAESTAYNLTFVMDGPDLFGNDVTSGSVTQTVTVLPCEVGETFNNETFECDCAAGFGLVVADHTCRQCAGNEVVPANGLSCASCPDFSLPSSSSECVCMPGYFGTIVGAVGACTKCPSDSFRSADDPPFTCRSCPPTSHTFALGATSELHCLCALNFFNDRSNLNSSFSCAPVPLGGWAPQADSRLFALEGFWRPDMRHTQFFECTSGLCLKEMPPANASALQLGHRCREGHTGHLCAVCEDNWAYRSTYCQECKAGQQWTEWGNGQKLVISFIVAGLIVSTAFLLFLLPLFPNTESMLAQAVAPAVERMEVMLSNVAAATRPMSSAGSRPTSARRNARMSRMSTTRRARASQPQLSGGGQAVVVQHATRVEVFLETIKEPVRIIVSFWQIVSSFSNNLYVPWPSIYYALANTLSVASLSFMRLPAINCIRPQLSFYTSFLTVTLSSFAFCVFAVLTYYIGQRTAVAAADHERKRRFKARVLNVFWWVAFLVYPQVSSTTLLIFACTPLEDGTSWLMADYRIQCWTPKHKLYAGLGGVWALLFPLGMPIAIVYSLYVSQVPHLARWKQACSWLRAIVQRSVVLGVHAPNSFHADTLTTESITTDHLRVLHTFFVADDDGSTDVNAQVDHGVPSVHSGSENGGVLTRRQLLHAVHASAVAHDDPHEHERDPLLETAEVVHAGSRRGSLRILQHSDEFATPALGRRGTSRLDAEAKTASQKLLHQPPPAALQESEEEREAEPPRMSRVRFSLTEPPPPEKTPLLAGDAAADAPVARASLWRVSSSQEPEPAEEPVPSWPPVVPHGDPPNSPVRRRSSVAIKAPFPEHDSDSDSDSDDAPPLTSPRMLRSVSSQLLSLQPHPVHHHPHPPPLTLTDRLRSAFRGVQLALQRVTAVRVRSVRRKMSTMMYRDEREKLTGALIEWALHDMHSSVLRPVNNMMRWRTMHEWDALRAAGVPLGDHDSAERAAFHKYRFLYADYAVHAWWWEAVDVLQKLFLTSVIAFIAPRTAVQVIIAAMFSFSMVLVTTQVKPYREGSNNALIALSQINIFLFLWTGLLLQTNPNGISGHRVLFSVIVGMLTTSIVLFTLYLFTRQLLWQLMAALYAVEDEEAAQDEAAEKEELLLAAEGGHDSDADKAAGDDTPEAVASEAVASGRRMSAARTTAGRMSAYAARRMSEHERAVAAHLPQSSETGFWARVRQHRLFILVVVAIIVGVSAGTAKHAKKPAALVVDDGVKRYTLVINREALPGSDKMQVTVNGTIPGPTLRMAAGQLIEVTVVNAMLNEDTAVHWHGMMQRGTPSFDGVPGITQCPIPANGSMVYTFSHNNPGSYWYHGHFNGQYPDGLYGALVVDDGGASVVAAAAGDSRAIYENDEWNWMVADWYDDAAMELLPAYLSPPSGGDEPMPDAIVVNNLMSNATGGGLVHRTSRGTKQRVRVTNAAAFSMWKVSVDGVPLTVIEVDGTTVEPHDLPYVVLNVAQRVSFVLDWARMASSLGASPAVFIRVEAMPSMYPTYDPTEPDDGLEGTAGGKAFDLTWLGLVRFDDADAIANSVPSYASSSPPRITLAAQAETNLVAARPYPPKAAPTATRKIYLEVVFQADDQGVNRAYLNGATYSMITPAQLRSPDLFSGAATALHSSPNANIACDANTPCVLPFGEVVELLINNTDGGEHPFHLHGHDFFVIDTSEAPDAEALYSPVFLRRDVVSIPAEGWARIRFVADNPGVWLMHCHIEWHMHAGLMVNFVEAPEVLLSGSLGTAPPAVAKTCAAYNALRPAR